MHLHSYLKVDYIWNHKASWFLRVIWNEIGIFQWLYLNSSLFFWFNKYFFMWNMDMFAFFMCVHLHTWIIFVCWGYKYLCNDSFIVRRQVQSEHWIRCSDLHSFFYEVLILDVIGINSMHYIGLPLLSI